MTLVHVDTSLERFVQHLSETYGEKLKVSYNTFNERLFLQAPESGFLYWEYWNREELAGLRAMLERNGLSLGRSRRRR